MYQIWLKNKLITYQDANDFTFQFFLMNKKSFLKNLKHIIYSI